MLTSAWNSLTLRELPPRWATVELEGAQNSVGEETDLMKTLTFVELKSSTLTELWSPAELNRLTLTKLSNSWMTSANRKQLDLNGQIGLGSITANDRAEKEMTNLKDDKIFSVANTWLNSTSDDTVDETVGWKVLTKTRASNKAGNGPVGRMTIIWRERSLTKWTMTISTGEVSLDLPV